MRINAQTDRMFRAGTELQELSRTVRKLGEETADVCREIRRQTELDRCRAELLRQSEALSALAARLDTLSSALREIKELYGRAEERDVLRAANVPGWYRN